MLSNTVTGYVCVQATTGPTGEKVSHSDVSILFYARVDSLQVHVFHARLRMALCTIGALAAVVIILSFGGGGDNQGWYGKRTCRPGA